MGTRNLTVVIKDNEIRLSQYGQWDGYFSYSGKKFLEFVKGNLQSKNKERQNYLIEKFGEKIDILEDVNEQYYDDIIKMSSNYNVSNPNKNTSNYAIPFSIMLPQFSRDTGVEILNVIDKLQPYEFGTRYKFPIKLCYDREVFTEFTNIINLDTQEIYMLTSHEFKCEPLSTCELVEKTYKQKCWYKSKIKNIPTIAKVQKYKESIELDYWQRDNGEWVSN